MVWPLARKTYSDDVVRSKLWRSGLQSAPGDLAIGSWDGVAHRGPDAQADAALRSRRPMASRCADHGQTDQLSHVIVCLSGSSDLGPAARRAWAVIG